ncbi:cupin domain-containing protein [Flavobacterium glaciei]|uniref:Uncharacterized protein n=1 Tax=Flavobacterium glaciei TaxID=386300 RepID=A0A562PU70_9FLAO|nr:cupin [Flavobacterium glaciei]RDI54995.1 hypothetical protein DFR66_106102 [Flavobacterium glaciei]TWI47903.1 hypothetical protein IQ02_01489 [Flavobacterium glaciei]
MPFKINAIDTNELTKSQLQVIVEISPYILNTVFSRTIIKKTTSNISRLSFDAGQVLEELTSPIANCIQTIDVTFEILFDNIKQLLTLGDGIVIPAYSPTYFNSNLQYRMMTKIIRSGCKINYAL